MFGLKNKKKTDKEMEQINMEDSSWIDNLIKEHQRSNNM